MVDPGAAQPPEALRVVLAGGHPFYRDGLATLLRANGIDVVGEAANGEAAIAAVKDLSPDVVIMDLNMPGVSGVEATRRLIEDDPGNRVLALSVSALEADVSAAIRAGATGYVLKDGPVEEIVAAVEAAAAGESLVSPAIAGMLLGRVRRAPVELVNAPLQALTTRELEVLSHLTQGSANSDIADALGLSAHTVRHHVSSILTKLGVDNRVQAAVRATRDRLV